MFSIPEAARTYVGPHSSLPVSRQAVRQTAEAHARHSLRRLRGPLRREGGDDKLRPKRQISRREKLDADRGEILAERHYDMAGSFPPNRRLAAVR